MKRIFYGSIPQKIKNATYWNRKRYHMGIYDAFKRACRMYVPIDSDLYKAFMADDFRKYIPGEYLPEYLNFEEYPLRYQEGE